MKLVMGVCEAPRACERPHDCGRVAGSGLRGRGLSIRLSRNGHRMMSQVFSHGAEQATTNAQPLLSVRGLTVRYGSITALDALSIDIERGQVISIVGPNGAGKSSLLAAIAGTVRPEAGRILFKGQQTIGQPLEQTVRRGIALVPEGRHVLASLTVLENLRLGATIRNDAAQVDARSTVFSRRFQFLASGAGRRQAGSRAASSRCW